MNFFVGSLGILIVILAIVFGIKKYSDNINMLEEDLENKYKGYKSNIFCAIIGIILFIFAFSFVIIPTGYTGVKTTFGQISRKTMSNGFNLKIPFVQSGADALKIAAEAEAEANKKVSNSITDKLVENKLAEDRLKHGWVTVKGANTVVSK